MVDGMPWQCWGLEIMHGQKRAYLQPGYFLGKVVEILQVEIVQVVNVQVEIVHDRNPEWSGTCLLPSYAS
jgi:hypothetical protein